MWISEMVLSQLKKRNDEIRKIPMNQKLTQALEDAKKGSRKGPTKIWKKKLLGG